MTSSMITFSISGANAAIAVPTIATLNAAIASALVRRDPPDQPPDPTC